MAIKDPHAGRKVLLFDDSDLCLEFEREVLIGEGFEVRTASTLPQFDSILTGWKPDIVLADVQMPEISGPELCKRLKQSVDTAHVPVVLFSNLPDAQLEKLAQHCGADAYLSKTSGFDLLPEKLSWLCEEILW